MVDKLAAPPRSIPGSRMNPRRVIIGMTVAIFFILLVISTLFFQGIPPCPILLCFAISHGAFCWIVSRVKPYHGPHTDPMKDRELSDWPTT
jgi:hypothetical protein